MGSLTSRPKVPKQTQPQVIYVPAPQPKTYTPLPSSTGGGASSQNEDTRTPEEKQEEEQSAVRVENLLRRNRGVGGTVKTGFRGLLSSNESLPDRKSLLGE
jgi:hypothetical protein